jgi:hypothetical protein
MQTRIRIPASEAAQNAESASARRRSDAEDVAMASGSPWPKEQWSECRRWNYVRWWTGDVRKASELANLPFPPHLKQNRVT